MSYNIKGDIEVFSPLQLEVILNVLKDFNFQGKEAVIEILGKQGDNFASEVRVIKIDVTKEKMFKIIIKKASSFGASSEINPLSNLSSIFFNNEITMYTEVLQIMTQLQISVGISEKDMFSYAKCYGAVRNKTKEIILLEDLSQDEYVMLDKYEPLTNQTIRIVLDNLATYHSLSYALKYRFPEKYLEFCNKLVDTQSLEENNEITEQFIGLGDNFSKLFNNHKYKNIVKQAFKEQINKTVKAADNSSKYSVIIHGDCWTNNMLFQMKNSLPIKCVFIDYQLSKESLPVADILCIIFNCTDYKTRSLYYYDWIDYYHHQLEKNLFIFGLKINNVYSREKLDSDLRRYSKVHLSMAMLMSSILLRKPAESSKMKDTFNEVSNPEDMLSFLKITNDLEPNTICKIKNKIEGLIDSCIEFGYLS